MALRAVPLSAQSNIRQNHQYLSGRFQAIQISRGSPLRFDVQTGTCQPQAELLQLAVGRISITHHVDSGAYNRATGVNRSSPDAGIIAGPGAIGAGSVPPACPALRKLGATEQNIRRWSSAVGGSRYSESRRASSARRG